MHGFKRTSTFNLPANETLIEKQTCFSISVCYNKIVGCIMRANNLTSKILLGTVGGITLFFGGTMLPMVIFADMVEGASRWPGIIMGSAFTLVSIFCFVKLFIISQRDKKYSRFAALIGNWKSIPIKWLADKMNCSDVPIHLLRQMQYVFI